MVSLDKAVTARLRKNNTQFEILVDPELALEFKKGKDISVENILAVSEIFKDARKGERIPERELMKHFGTTDIYRIAEEIIKNGDIQITTEQRRKLVEENKKQIAYMISRKGVDPKTNLPHPISRILNAMEEARVNIDPFKPPKEQFESVLERIREIIPIKVETVEIAVKVPIQYAGRVNSVLRNMVLIKKEEWKGDGWIAVIQIPSGMQSEIYAKLNELTSGSVETKIIKKT